MKIKAGLVTAPFEGGIAMLDVRDPGPADVVIATEYSFVSNGTERHTHRGEFPEPPAKFPMVMGYQCAGRITHAGAAVKDCVVGQRVFTRRNDFVGVSNPIGGVHAATVVTAATNVIPVPDDVAPMEAAALVIAQVGYNTAFRFPESPGKTVMVLGDGMIGQFTAQVLAHRGFRVLLTGHHDCRLNIAKAACAALQVANSTHANFDNAFMDFAGGKQTDMAVDTAGTRETIAECLRRTRALGHVAVPGYQGGDQSLDIHRAFAGEYTVHFPAGATRDRLLATLDLIRAGIIRVAPLVTHRLTGAEFGRACRLIGGTNAACLGIALAWQEEAKS